MTPSLLHFARSTASRGWLRPWVTPSSSNVRMRWSPPSTRFAAAKRVEGGLHRIRTFDDDGVTHGRSHPLDAVDRAKCSSDGVIRRWSGFHLVERLRQFPDVLAALAQEQIDVLREIQ